MICLDKPTLWALLHNGTVIGLYSIVMILVGIVLAILTYFFYRTGWKGLFRGIDFMIFVIKNWKELKKAWKKK